ncbi:MAG TPA: helix-hairpin-helix domain-containing protein [Chitinophagaceae bacterium]|nr:helix-hairpin-helix domain-containing protein [Chitinophagaceae bacterium]
MKLIFFISLLFFIQGVFSQGVPVDEIENQLEMQAENSDQEIEDDSWIEYLNSFRIHPLNINAATEEDLSQFRILTPIQISNLLRYRSLLGNLIHVNELQAVPGWDPALIRKLIPFIRVGEYQFSKEKLRQRFQNGEQFLLMRASQTLERVSNYDDSSASKYLGSPQGMLLKFQYSYGKLLQFGVLAEKDAGEPWQFNKVLDFFSFHFFAREIGLIKKLSLGDFQVNLGQGLIQWQGFSNRKSGNVMMIKKQDEHIRPYRSSGEINFHRGMAITMAKNNWEWMVFASIRKKSANIILDSLSNPFISSFLNSGYHRTAGEINDRKSVKQFSSGGKISYSFLTGRVGLNYVQFNFSSPVQKKDDPYQLHSFKGRRLANWSMDYDYTIHNLHLFGEFAVDQHLNKAWLHGMLLSLDQRVDLALVFRSISPAYESFNSSAFTENSSPINETGIYAGMSFRLTPFFRLDAYTDFFYFPWLRFGTDAPSLGRDFIFQLNWQPNKRLALYGRWKFESKESNLTEVEEPTKKLVEQGRRNFRFQFNWDCSKKLSVRERVETSLYTSGSTAERGFLLFTDVNYHLPFKPFKFAGRLLFFETDGYDSRIYTFESDVMYGFSVPAFSGKGVHYAGNIYLKPGRWLNKTGKLKEGLGLWMSMAQTIFAGNSGFINGNDKINRKQKTTIRIQLVMNW